MVLASFEVIVICPIHRHSIMLHSIEAKDHIEAIGKAVGENVFCKIPEGRGHRVVIHSEDIVGWQPISPSYMPAELAERKVFRPEEYVPPPPPEKIHYLSGPEKRVRQEWWR